MATDLAPLYECAGCGETMRLPTLLAARNFERRGKRCLPCSTGQDVLEEILDAMLIAADWSKVPLAAKLAIAAEVAR